MPVRLLVDLRVFPAISFVTGLLLHRVPSQDDKIPKMTKCLQMERNPSHFFSNMGNIYPSSVAVTHHYCLIGNTGLVCRDSDDVNGCI